MDIEVPPNGSQRGGGERGRSGSRPRVISYSELAARVSQARQHDHVAIAAAADEQRPRTRDDCRDGERPCPWVGCRHHLYLSVTDNGGIQVTFPDLEPWELTETCSLDVADRGGMTLEEVGEIANLTRERIRQLETRGLLRLKARRGDLGR